MKDSDGKRDEIARHYMQKRAERNAEWQWPKEILWGSVACTEWGMEGAAKDALANDLNRYASDYARYFVGDERRVMKSKLYDWHVLYVDYKGKQQHIIQAQGEADSSSYWGAANADMKRRDQEGMLVGYPYLGIVEDSAPEQVEAQAFPARAMAAVSDAPPNRWSHCLGVLPKIY